MRPARRRKRRVRGARPPEEGPNSPSSRIPHLDRVIDPLRDDAAAETGDAADLGAGGRLAGAHHVDDAQQARHLVGLSAEAQRGLPGHGRFLTQPGALQNVFERTYGLSYVHLGTSSGGSDQEADMAYGVGIIGAGPGVAALHLPTLARLEGEFRVVHVADGGQRQGGSPRGARRRARVHRR